jgi:MFS family permease
LVAVARGGLGEVSMGAVLLLVLLAGANFFNVIDRNVVSLFMPVIREDLGLSATQQGLILGLAFILVLSFVALPLARMTDRFGARHVIGGSLFVWSLATLVSGFTSSFSQLFGTRMIVGAAEAGFTPAAHTALTAIFSGKRLGRALAVFTLGVSAGQILGFYYSGKMAATLGWRGGLQILGLGGIALAILIWLLWPLLARGKDRPAQNPTGPRPGFIEGFRSVFRVPGYGPLVLAAMSHSVAAYAVQQMLPTFMTDHYGMPISERGTWMGPIFSLPAFIGTVGIGFLIDFFNPKTKLRTCLRLSAFSVFATVPVYWMGLMFPEHLGFVATGLAAALNFIVPGLVADNYAGLTAFVIAFFFGAIYYSPTYFTLQHLATNETRATANAVLLTSFQIAGLGLGPTLVGIGTDVLKGFGVAAPLPIAMSAVASFNLLSGVLFMWTAHNLAKANYVAPLLQEPKSP